MSATASRETYRHGDLHQALLDVAIGMARDGGPDAVVLREATRIAGVSPNAAYRHFSDRRALVLAVSSGAQRVAADRMVRAVEGVTSTGDRVADARSRLRAIGVSYIDFARTEPGLFRAAFTVPDDLHTATDPEKAGEAGLTPFQVLGRVLDELAEAGGLPSDRRPNAELLAWSAVHGLGMLVIDGPLRGLPSTVVAHATQQLLDMVERGL